MITLLSTLAQRRWCRGRSPHSRGGRWGRGERRARFWGDPRLTRRLEWSLAVSRRRRRAL